ncbi:MAG: threonine--tRNA ligase, partial [Actinomycetes bacterium]
VAAIEQRMRELIERDYDVVKKMTPRAEVVEVFKSRGEDYKLRLIEDMPDEQAMGLYYHEEYVDMCRGPHVPNTRFLKAFKLTRISGAYWRGDSKNEQLQRIYGTAFPSKEELAKHLEMLEQSKLRDHRKLGKELEIFAFDPDVGPGLPLWLPNGTVMIEELEKLAKETEFAAGYKRVRSPHLAKDTLYKTSGHLPY